MLCDQVKRISREFQVGFSHVIVHLYMYIYHIAIAAITESICNRLRERPTNTHFLAPVRIFFLLSINFDANTLSASFVRVGKHCSRSMPFNLLTSISFSSPQMSETKKK